MKLLTNFTRIIVGVLFILSGFVKLVDPKGLAYKLEEYFSPDVFNLPALAQIALGLSVFFVILEVILGLLLLLGFGKKITLFTLSVLILFFTFLTFYSAFYNKVTDCGCFGDALKLSPWESFYKDVILCILVVILWLGFKHIQPLFNQKLNWGIAFVALLISSFIAYYGINHLPMIDFRPFAVGNNIPNGMLIPKGAKKDSIAMVFRYQHQNKVLEFSSDELDKIPSDAKFLDRQDKVIQEGYKPPIKSDFALDCNGKDLTDDYMKQNRLLMIVVPIASQTNKHAINKLNQLTKDIAKEDIAVVTATNSNIGNTNTKQCTMDATMLKTIIRSNPGILLISKGTILAKYHYNDAPSKQEVINVFESY